MTEPVVQSVNGLYNARFTIWVSGAVDLREYHCSMLAIGLHVLPGQPLVWAREHRNWCVEDWKRVTWSDESRFRLLNANGTLRIWRQAEEAMDPACQVGTVQGHGGSMMVRGVFS
ncbi:uncharacterized protein TNCV_1469691 [Trichonephila clavipes]|nr:uncharacterized protein TNCV_1469691 [Trichonephila clavipes]